MWGVGGTLASMDHFTISAKQLPNMSLLNTCQHLSDFLLLLLNNQFGLLTTKHNKTKKDTRKNCAAGDGDLKLVVNNNLSVGLRDALKIYFLKWCFSC